MRFVGFEDAYRTILKSVYNTEIASRSRGFRRIRRICRFRPKVTSALLSGEFQLLRTETGALPSDKLAERLSYFLWSAPPDSTLRRATREFLESNDPSILKSQVSRMLESPKSDAFIEHFLDH
jgi:hypothetical protein